MRTRVWNLVLWPGACLQMVFYWQRWRHWKWAPLGPPWSLLRNIFHQHVSTYTHDWNVCVESRSRAKKNSGWKTCRLSPDCEENKVNFTIYQPIPPKLTNRRGPPYDITPGGIPHTELLICILERQRSKSWNISYYFSCSALTAGTEALIDNYRIH